MIKCKYCGRQLTQGGNYYHNCCYYDVTIQDNAYVKETICEALK